MKFRKLRIAWSVGCGIACVLLIVLWVRSYSHRDTFEKIDALGITVCSIQRGTLMFARMLGNVAFDEIGHWNWTVDYEAIQSNFTAATYADEWIFIPLWFPVLLLAVSATLPWIRQLRWRFSLRTLLIATTLVAVVLGLVVWATH